ncbi:MAG: hypothetical protein B7X60_02895 [Polynucleobacter sp. 39-45-136]|jgi:dolichol-phosphate mannosyltransferase|nr:MAG: hypothetical protein B7X60_02895 [Polynucleobacter sp. 39-45-136]
MKNNFTLVILNKNDADSLELVIREIDFSLFDEIVGIDGDSQDRSIDVFNKYGIRCYQNIPGGRGGAIKYAINNINTNYIIFLSSDGEENPAELSIMRDELISGADLVIASRVLGNNSGFKSDHDIRYLHRKLFLVFISSLISILFGSKIKDSWNGYRGLNVLKARSINLDADNFLIEAQMTIRFLKNSFTIKEFPTTERPRYFGASQNPAIQSGWGHIVLLFNEFFKK